MWQERVGGKFDGGAGGEKTTQLLWGRGRKTPVDLLETASNQGHRPPWKGRCLVEGR